MKISFRMLVLVLWTGLLGNLLAGCDDDDDKLNTTITGVSNLFAPADNSFVRLLPATSATVAFEWEAARAEDGTVVQYEVLFDKEAGDFSAPVFASTSGQNGLEPRLTLTHAELNKIANLAGIQALTRGKLKWTVAASKGTNVVRATATRLLEVERPAGFSEIPADLFLTGDATEAGTNLAQAIKFKQVASGVFELYTSLKPGTYRFVDRASGTGKQFYITGSVIREGSTGSTSPATAKQPYRLSLDFNNAAATLTQIRKVSLWVAAENRVTQELTYRDNSSWKVENALIEFFQESWGRDERYKFILTEVDAAGQVTEKQYGSTNIDNQRPTDTSPPSYYYVVPVATSRYDYTFKWKSAVDRARVDMTLKMQPAAPYTHEVVVR